MFYVFFSGSFVQLDDDHLEKHSKGKKTFTQSSQEKSKKTKLHRKTNREKVVNKKIETPTKNIAGLSVASAKQGKVVPESSCARKENATKQMNSKAAKVQHLNNLKNTDGKNAGASDAAKSTNLHEVVVIDAENVLQLCDKDTASRFEVMFGESKVIAQLFDIKRKSGNQSDEKAEKEQLVSGLVESEGKVFYDFNALSDSKSSSISSKEEALKSRDIFTELCMKNLLKKAETKKN